MCCDMEIERKFLVDDDAVLPAGAAPRSIRQGYLAVDARAEVRVRADDDLRELTAKVGRGRSRAEESVRLDDERFEALWALTEGRRLEKARTVIALDGGLAAEVDVYAGVLAGLRVVEVEFASEAAADAFTPPAWFGPELTDDDRYANRALAEADEPPPAPPAR
jgi:adenylate cyclase